MTFVPALLKAHADFKAGTTDFTAYKAEIDAIMNQIEAQTVEEKAEAFDKMFETVRLGMTEQDEPVDGSPHMIWFDSDSIHYAWESQMQAIFGEDFFDFYNTAYTSG